MYKKNNQTGIIAAEGGNVAKADVPAEGMTLKHEQTSIPVEVEFRNVKTLRITVYPPDGRVRIISPAGANRDDIKNFAASKIAWIQKQREKFLNNSKLTTSIKNNSKLFVWGDLWELEIIERRGNPKITFEDGKMKMYVRPDSTKAKRQEFLVRWYGKILKDAAIPLIEIWEERIGVEVKKLFVRRMKSHWGSCNSARQTLRLNSELAKRRRECLEYVIVHEMLHIIEKSHNRKFYSLLNSYMPEWKIIRKKMNSGEF
jgi:predicted metal-dependent hydrolase